jgi:hypothetical protein
VRTFSAGIEPETNEERKPHRSFPPTTPIDATTMPEPTSFDHVLKCDVEVILGCIAGAVYPCPLYIEPEPVRRYAAFKVPCCNSR